MVAGGPGAARLEAVALGWLVGALSLPEGTAGGFVSGATMANFSGLAAARHALLEREDWDVEARGLFGAPPITVIVGEEVHVSLLKALALLGLGRGRVTRVPVDDQGRIDPDRLPAIAGPTILCLQAGKLAAGVTEADSWATDAHKWLNVPYDSGLVFVREAGHLEAAMAATAAYLVRTDEREPDRYTPELSRRARGVDVWAALASLGRSGLAGLIEGCCAHAAWLADGLRAAGHEVLNEVALNQVLVRFGDAERTQAVIAAVQAEGVCWCGGTVWRGRTAMRISVSSWRTTRADCERSLAAILAAV